MLAWLLDGKKVQEGLRYHMFCIVGLGGRKETDEPLKLWSNQLNH